MLPAVLLLAAMTGLALVLLGMLTGRAAKLDDRVPFGALAGDRGLPGMVVPVRKCAMKARLALPLLLLANAAPAAQKSAPAAARRATAFDRWPADRRDPEADAAGKGVRGLSLEHRRDSRVLVAMATADPAQLRVSLDGTITDVARTAQQGAGGFGFSGVTEYRGGAVSAVLDMTITTRNDLKDGASVPQATLRIDREGQDSVVLPVAGLIGCV